MQSRGSSICFLAVMFLIFNILYNSYTNIVVGSTKVGIEAGINKVSHVCEPNGVGS